jgi:AcrR family transcriptional regulator
MGSARSKRREETRERLFEAALREFREYGLAGAQIDRIAKSAGVVRGTFYFHFPSKDDVLLELATRVNARITRRVSNLRSSEPSLEGLLKRVNDAIVDEHTRIGEAGLQAELAALYMRRPRDLQMPSEHDAPSLAGMLTEQFGRIRASGGIRSTVPDELAAVVFMTSLFGVFVRIPPGERRREACEALIAFFVSGLTSAGPIDSLTSRID